MDTNQGVQTKLTNWSKSARSSCIVYKVNSETDIARVLAFARTEHLTLIPHGAGHSYTDAALNTGGLVLDVTLMRQILSWDPAQGIMRVEPGVTLRDVVQTAAKDGWWPFVSPSTPDVTIGGCVAMNVNGRNAWKNGPFGAHILSLNVSLITGELLTLVPERDSELLRAFVGSMGLLGIITSITLQLQRITSGSVNVRMHSAASLHDILSLFAEEEPRSDFMEAWLDGFAGGNQLGRGILTCATTGNYGGTPPYPVETRGIFGRLEAPLVSLAASLGRPVLLPIVQLANRANYRWGQMNQTATGDSAPCSRIPFGPHPYCRDTTPCFLRELRHFTLLFRKCMRKIYSRKSCATHSSKGAFRFGVLSSSIEPTPFFLVIRSTAFHWN